MSHRIAGFLLSASLLVLAGCDDDAADGSLSVVLESEDVIVEGLQPGTEGENIADGWAVDFDKYLIAVGDVDVHLSTDESVEAHDESVFVVDLTEVPATGLDLFSIPSLVAGRWELNYATPGAADGATRHSSVSQTDFDTMVAADWTYLVEGTMSAAEGQSCPPAALAAPGSTESNGETSGGNACYDATSVRFTFGASAETNFGPCEIDGVSGFSITAGSTQSVTATIHGDHLFFNGFPEGDEGGIQRLAQWLADCDLDLDGVVTQEELEQIAPSQLPEIDDRFQLGGSPITPINNMYEYIRAQLKTQGHFQGEGECPVDGVEHDHD